MIANKTYAEISEAYNAGKTVLLTDGEAVYGSIIETTIDSDSAFCLVSYYIEFSSNILKKVKHYVHTNNS